MAALAVGAIAPLTFGLVACGEETTPTANVTVGVHTAVTGQRVGDININGTNGQIHRYAGEGTWNLMLTVTNDVTDAELTSAIGTLDEAVQAAIAQLRGEIPTVPSLPTVVSQAVTIQTSLDAVNEVALANTFEGVTGHTTTNARPVATTTNGALQTAWHNARRDFNDAQRALINPALTAHFTMNDCEFFGGGALTSPTTGVFSQAIPPIGQTRRDIFLVKTNLSALANFTNEGGAGTNNALMGFGIQDANTTSGAVSLAAIEAVPTLNSRINAVNGARFAINQLGTTLPVMNGTLQTNSGTATEPVLAGTNVPAASAATITAHAQSVLNASTAFVNLANNHERGLVNNLEELNRHRAHLGLPALTTASTTTGVTDLGRTIAGTSTSVTIDVLAEIGFATNADNVTGRVTLATAAATGGIGAIGSMTAASFVPAAPPAEAINAHATISLTGVTGHSTVEGANNVHTIGYIVVLVRTEHAAATISGSTFNAGTQGTNVLTVRRVVITRTAS
jgi:hypothetical protein